MSHLVRFNQNVNFWKEYIQEHGRGASLPAAKYISVKFHPTIRDHIIVLSEVSCPNKAHIETLVDEDVVRGFRGQMQQRYINRAKKGAVRRNRKALETPHDNQFDIDSSHDISEVSIGDDEYEGGRKKKTKTNHINLNLDEHDIRTNNRVTGNYLASRPIDRNSAGIFNKSSIDPEVYCRAVDMYIEENSKAIVYKDLDEALKKDEYYDTDESMESDYESDEIFDENTPYNAKDYINFRQIPLYEGLKYVAPLFRHRYEISIWKADAF